MNLFFTIIPKNRVNRAPWLLLLAKPPFGLANSKERGIKSWSELDFKRWSANPFRAALAVMEDGDSHSSWAGATPASLPRSAVHLAHDPQSLSSSSPAPLPGSTSGHAKLPGGFVIGTNGDWDETTQLAFIYRLSQDVSPSLQKKKPTVLTHCAT